MKFPHRRQFLQLAAGAASLPAVSSTASAQAYPTRAVRLFVGGPPGSSIDIIPRLIGPTLADRLGQPFLVDNRPGANGNNAAEAVANSDPDGYTLLLVGGANAISATLYKNQKFSLLRDIVPLLA